MRQLLMAAVDMPLEYEQDGRDGALATLLLHEAGPAATLAVAHPAARRSSAGRAMPRLLQHPDAHDSAQRWAPRLYMSIRTFSRFFRAQTGLPFSQWRQRACVVLALALLAEGRSVTQVAMEMGYDSSAAFSTMFRRVLGQAPSSYLTEDGRDG